MLHKLAAVLLREMSAQHDSTSICRPLLSGLASIIFVAITTRWQLVGGDKSLSMVHALNIAIAAATAASLAVLQVL